MERQRRLGFRGVRTLLLAAVLVGGLLGTATLGAGATAKSVQVAIISGTGSVNGGQLPTSSFQSPDPYADFTFTNVPVANLTAAELAKYDSALLNVASSDIACNLANLSAAQKTALVDFVGNGGKLMIYDSECANNDYSFLPYNFTTNNPGQLGANGTLTDVEDNSLSDTDPSDPRWIDTAAISTQTDAVGDANVFTTFDPNWCVDMTGKNASGVDGPVITYARYSSTSGKTGLFIYDGLDMDSTGVNPDNNSGSDALSKIWLQFLQQSFNPDNLPCGVSANGISLSPDGVTNPVGTQHTVTATVTNSQGAGQQGVLVTFTVKTGPNAATTGTCNPSDCTTDSDGNVTFTYTGDGGAGTDTIQACFTDESSSQVCSREVTKIWEAGTAAGFSCLSVHFKTPLADGDSFPKGTYIRCTGDSNAKGTFTNKGFLNIGKNKGVNSVLLKANKKGPASVTFTPSGGAASTINFTIT